MPKVNVPKKTRTWFYVNGELKSTLLFPNYLRRWPNVCTPLALKISTNKLKNSLVRIRLSVIFVIINRVYDLVGGKRSHY